MDKKKYIEVTKRLTGIINKEQLHVITFLFEHYDAGSTIKQISDDIRISIAQTSRILSQLNFLNIVKKENDIWYLNEDIFIKIKNELEIKDIDNHLDEGKLEEKFEAFNDKYKYIMDIINEYQQKAKESQKELKLMQEKIDSFYNKLGEILALIITGISMIVFNIKVADNKSISFSNPKQGFLSLLGLELPFIILVCIGILLFHFITDVKVNYKNICVILGIIALCSCLLIV